MSWLALALLAIPGCVVVALGCAIVRFHARIGTHHLRGRYTWAEELAALDDLEPPAGERESDIKTRTPQSDAHAAAPGARRCASRPW